ILNAAKGLDVHPASPSNPLNSFPSMVLGTNYLSILNAAKGLDVHPASPSNPLNSFPSMVLGTNYLSPLTMATAYAGIANGGVVCTPIAIDRVVNADGSARAVTPSKCTQGLAPNIAAGVAYALKGVLQGGGTAASANPDDGVPIMGKTGTTD
ncbi:penicillin-binding transpeptidase domain-containing protein, partial [Paenibacillus sp. TAF58]